MPNIVLHGNGVSNTLPHFTPAFLIDIEWLAATFNHWSAPAIKPIGGQYSTIKRTLSKDEFYEYWRSPDKIIALRFAGRTRYIVLDIDWGSQYHPSRNHEAFNAILAVLEDVGLCSPIIYQSSDSGGLHVLYPLPEERPTYAIARTIEMVLARAGFWLKDGHLEAYPNRKSWIDSDTHYQKGRFYSELFDYQAVRVPCQKDCVLLDSQLEPADDNSLEEFRFRWEWAVIQQDMETFDEVIEFYADKANWPKKPRKYGKLADIEKDYLELLETGWTANGETNEILYHLTRLTRIMEPCPDSDLATVVMEKAIAMPGYAQHCRHQHDIEQRCRDWARSILRKGKYYYHGDRLKTEPKESKRDINTERQNRAIKRLENCLKGFIKNGFTFTSKTQIISAVVKALKCSKTTIIKHWNLLLSLVSQLLQNEGNRTDSKQPCDPCPVSDAATTPRGGTHPHLLRVDIPEHGDREKEKLVNLSSAAPPEPPDTLRNPETLVQLTFWPLLGGDSDE
ncbi:hypothetical protein [Picosynechococcus sp. PCC 7117]|uniref:hypothetical protein n=2 Tax=Picosynechococcus sp. PCC 7117 TaxID=195498 RepID=UPI00081039F8|nr:hypothetical protein [Picosynechococcus sp. PCC 7117]ANV88865.1 hypothetical protein AWQ22_14710 [Picosynechococcus sp. PCC 7117]